ncbi:hypothetical protein Tco_0607990 [Tanacetum coccineum]
MDPAMHYTTLPAIQLVDIEKVAVSSGLRSLKPKRTNRNTTDNKSPTHYPCDSARTFRVILFSIHSDEWKSFKCQHQAELWYKRRCCSLTPAESDSLPHAHTQATQTYYKHQDSRIKKAQELNTKTSANSDIQDLPKDIKINKTKIVKGDC